MIILQHMLNKKVRNDRFEVLPLTLLDYSPSGHQIDFTIGANCMDIEALHMGMKDERDVSWGRAPVGGSSMFCVSS